MKNSYVAGKRKPSIVDTLPLKHGGTRGVRVAARYVRLRQPWPHVPFALRDLGDRGDAVGHVASREALGEDDVERLRHRDHGLDRPGCGRSRHGAIDERARARRRTGRVLVSAAADRCDRQASRARRAAAGARRARAGDAARPGASPAAPAAGPAAAGLRPGARPCEVARQQMCGGAGILVRRGIRHVLREVRREALVERDDRDAGCRCERLDERLCLARLLASLAAQRQRQADDDPLRPRACESAPRARRDLLGACALDHADGTRDRTRRVRHGDAGARPAVVQREHLHFSAAAIACLPASSASRNPAGFLPPASASVGRPPPPPPMWRPISRTSCDASRPLPDERLVEIDDEIRTTVVDRADDDARGLLLLAQTVGEVAQLTSLGALRLDENDVALALDDREVGRRLGLRLARLLAGCSRARGADPPPRAGRRAATRTPRPT